MNFIKQIERIQILNKLILKECTGTPDELAERLGMGRRQLYRLLELLKDWDAPIKYNKRLRTFYYEGEYELEVKFSLKTLTPYQNQTIYGGTAKKIMMCHEMAQSKNRLVLQLTG